MTLGLIEFGGRQPDNLPLAADGWRLIRLTAKNRRQSERTLSNPRLDAVAIVSVSPEKTHLAELALANKKHVLIDFPASDQPLRAAKLNKIATSVDKRIYTPNLLRTEPGVQELKRIITSPASKLLSLTVTYGVTTRLKDSGFFMRTVQILDAMEWLVGSTFTHLSTERSAVNSRAEGLVVLASFESGISAMLNMYSAPANGYCSPLWIDAVLADSVVHVDTQAQSLRVTSFRNEAVKNINWATPSLTVAIEDFIAYIKTEKQPFGVGGLERALRLAAVVLSG
jgi:predicted dehydrogenase